MELPLPFNCFLKLACTYQLYQPTINKILQSTRTISIEKKGILAKQITNNTSVQIASDILFKYASVFLCQFGYSIDIAYSKKGVRIETEIDPLLYLMNYRITTRHRHFFKDKRPSDFVKARFKWPHFIYSEILDHYISGKACDIEKAALREFLTGFIICRQNVNHAVDDLYAILNSVNPNKLKGNRCIVNPSFYQIHYDNETTHCHADLIIDDTLLEIKTTGVLQLSKDYLSQLLFYYFWITFESEEALAVDEESNRNCYSNSITSVNNIGILFPRYDYMYTLPISDLFKSEKALVKARNIFFKEVISDK